jgi:hypothetical protein
MGCVQSKVIAVNMLIQNDFLKANRLKNGRFLEPIRGPIRHALSTIRASIFGPSSNGHQSHTIQPCLQADAAWLLSSRGARLT